MRAMLVTGLFAATAISLGMTTARQSSRPASRAEADQPGVQGSGSSRKHAGSWLVGAARL